MLFDLVVGWVHARRVPGLATETARVLTGRVQQAVGHRALRMPRAEAKGYIRGKATPIVDAYLTASLRPARGFHSPLRLRLAEEVTERLVRLVLDEVLRAKALAAPMRRAA